MNENFVSLICTPSVIDSETEISLFTSPVVLPEITVPFPIVGLEIFSNLCPPTLTPYSSSNLFETSFRSSGLTVTSPFFLSINSVLSPLARSLKATLIPNLRRLSLLVIPFASISLAFTKRFPLSVPFSSFEIFAPVIVSLLPTLTFTLFLPIKEVCSFTQILLPFVKSTPALYERVSPVIFPTPALIPV